MSRFERHFAHWPPMVPKTLAIPRTSLYYNLEVRDGFAQIPDRPGTGIAWDEKAVKKHAL